MSKKKPQDEPSSPASEDLGSASTSVDKFGRQDPDALCRRLKEMLDDRGGWSDEAQSIFGECHKRVQIVREKLGREFLDRGEAIDLLLASTMAGTPVVLFGPPGTGKTRLVKRLGELCGLVSADGSRSGYFEYLLTQHTMPEELFGPPSIKQLQEGRFERVTENMLPQAQLAFLDEVFRGGSHILNTLLSIINERRFHDGPRVSKVPLIQVVGAANEEPSDPELLAFYDRFPLRHWLASVFDDGGDDRQGRAKDLLDLAASLKENKDVRVEACIQDFWALQTCLVQEAAPESARQAFVDAFLRFRPGKYCRLSDRSLLSLWLVARAFVLLERGPREYGEDVDYTRVFKYVAPNLQTARMVRHDLGDSDPGLTSGH